MSFKVIGANGINVYSALNINQYAHDWGVHCATPTMNSSTPLILFVVHTLGHFNVYPRPLHSLYPAAVDPPAPTTEKAAVTTDEEMYASGILKKPSFRLPSPWKAAPPGSRGASEPSPAAATPERSRPGQAGTFDTFRPSSRLLSPPGSNNVSHRPSIVLEEVLSVMPTEQPATADTEC